MNISNTFVELFAIRVFVYNLTFMYCPEAYKYIDKLSLMYQQVLYCRLQMLLYSIDKLTMPSI